MVVTFVDIRDKQSLTNIKIAEGNALMGLNIEADNAVTKEGIPQHRVYQSQKVVSFGIQRHQRQEERNSIASVAHQALNFRLQYPQWAFNTMYRPVYDINPDDTLAAGILDIDLGPVLRDHGTKLNALVAELSSWNANKYTYAKEFKPTLLNNALNEFPFPFKDIPGKTRLQSVSDYFYDQESWFVENIERIEPTTRVFPSLKYEVVYKNKFSALIFVDSDRYGSDDLVAQLYFHTNPECVRVILVRKIFNSVKHFVNIVNSHMFDSNMNPYNYPNIKDLNTLEKRFDGDPSWKNLKLSAAGPRKGTGLALDAIWASSKVFE